MKIVTEKERFRPSGSAALPEVYLSELQCSPVAGPAGHVVDVPEQGYEERSVLLTPKK